MWHKGPSSLALCRGEISARSKGGQADVAEVRRLSPYADAYQAAPRETLEAHLHAHVAVVFGRASTQQVA